MLEDNSLRLGLLFAYHSANQNVDKSPVSSSLSKKQDKKKGNGKENNSKAVKETYFNQEKFDLVKSVGEECIMEEDLKKLMTVKKNFRVYDGFEPSGRMHIAQGVFKAVNVNKVTSSGATAVFWVADWFGLMNDKMGGDLEKIKTVGKYFIEVWKGTGMDLTNVEFRWASDNIINDAEAYWSQTLDIARAFTIARIKKCCQIMGRLEGNLTAAQVLYPLMQCSDVFYLKADICQLGVDQRKVNMLAREYCDFSGRKNKPVILSHHMIYGLAPGQAKMSKSNPDSAIFMEDTTDEVERKINKAYCPKIADLSLTEKGNGEDSMCLVEDELKNPCLDYVKHIILSTPGSVFLSGDDVEYKSFENVKNDFLSGKLSEKNLKSGLIRALDKKIQPVRDHFANDPHAKEILAKVVQYKKEDKELKTPKRLIRTSIESISDDKSGTASSIVVVAPRPIEQHWPLGDILTISSLLTEARKINKSNDDIKSIVLYIPDLCSLADNCFGEDKKRPPRDCINAAYTIFLKALESFEALGQDIKIVWQSEVMLSDPSNYWLSVINVGRHYQLQELHEAVGLDQQKVGTIVAAMMYVGDILALAPHTLLSIEKSAEYSLNKLASKYIDFCKDQENAIPVPNVLNGLLSEHATTSSPDDITLVRLMVNDKYKQHVGPKFKKAFCEPDNALVNPVLNLAKVLFFSRSTDSSSKINVVTSSGSCDFLDFESLKKACAEKGKIHPKDLKDAIRPIVESAYKKIEKSYASVDSKKRNLVEKYKPK